MWRPLVCERLASRVCRVLAATDVAKPAAEQIRWSSNIKMTKGLKKMFDRRGASKKKQFSGPVNLINAVTQDAEINRRRKPAYTEGQKRRAHQVGRVLYDNIVQLVNSGELCPQLAVMSVEIVQVKVVPNFSAVNVYWLSSGSQEDQIVEQLFKKQEGLLRQMLTSRHILGVIPRINFVKDDSRARYLEVESLLSKADFGQDFTPTRLDTSVRDIFLTERLKDSPDLDRLQEKFDQMSHTSATEKAEFRPSEAQLSMADRQFDDGSGEKEKTLYKKSNKTSHLESCSIAADGKSTQTHERESLMRQPSSLEVEQLHSQFLSEISVGVVQTTSNVENPKKSDNLDQQDTNSACKGFRDDLYGVPHTQLLNKVLLRKQKAGTRPAEISREKEVEALMQKLEPRNLKALLQKRAKTKGRLASQSDFVKAGIESLSETEGRFGVEDEELADDDFEEETLQTSGHPPDQK